ncbi:PC4-domain-containing protein [Metschnikowia bicuspidata var. bicuspidata NRRL YB-4993]|uniref:PC4-domain-containing protein n=1 Tax=Metschnikowia bicuspidata var. bicuspidata NRRL YB-4993 TaxID=869754 RepID=A0A1A0HFM0_9ASCO|nr:PC4-domain-containing protein [Metschnikowia bicuspidata var. bicuspidata NRRL YB-4993]OBA22692.1 PC4-domain-containing protein [Metschnikowia bicuspidata var. bicuspidata NRRL YB-4993]
MAYPTKAAKRTAPSEENVESVFELDAKKQVTVRKFNGINLVDIREFYIDKNTQEKKPGKKGISLTAALWRKLLDQKDEIDKALGALDGEPKKAKKDESSMPADGGNEAKAEESEAQGEEK